MSEISCRNCFDAFAASTMASLNGQVQGKTNQAQNSNHFHLHETKTHQSILPLPALFTNSNKAALGQGQAVLLLLTDDGISLDAFCSDCT